MERRDVLKGLLSAAAVAPVIPHPELWTPGDSRAMEAYLSEPQDPIREPTLKAPRAPARPFLLALLPNIGYPSANGGDTWTATALRPIDMTWCPRYSEFDHYGGSTGIEIQATVRHGPAAGSHCSDVMVPVPLPADQGMFGAWSVADDPNVAIRQAMAALTC